jgi:hypothetical protein
MTSDSISQDLGVANAALSPGASQSKDGLNPIKETIKGSILMYKI